MTKFKARHENKIEGEIGDIGYAPSKFQTRKKSLAYMLTGSYDFNMQKQLELVRNHCLGCFRTWKQKGFDQKSQTGKLTRNHTIKSKITQNANEPLK